MTLDSYIGGSALWYLQVCILKYYCENKYLLAFSQGAILYIQKGIPSNAALLIRFTLAQAPLNGGLRSGSELRDSPIQTAVVPPFRVSLSALATAHIPLQLLSFRAMILAQL